VVRASFRGGSPISFASSESGMVWTATYPSWIAPCFGHLSLKRGSFISSEHLLRFVHARPILSSVLNVPKNSVVQQYRKLVRFHGADMLFTDAAIKEIARIALEQGASRTRT
jgi:hypothetical protein